MESLEESNCQSLGDSFSLYERYLRSFNVVDNFVEDNQNESSERASSLNDDSAECSNATRGNIDLSAFQANNLVIHENLSSVLEYNLLDPSKQKTFVGSGESYLDVDSEKHQSYTLQANSFSLHDYSSTTADQSLINEHSEPTDVPVSSEDSRPERFKPPIFITSTMENSNNAVDSVPMFRNVMPSENVFKLPIRELSFNGTLKHVQKLKPIVDPLTALGSKDSLVSMNDQRVEAGLGKAEHSCDNKNDSDHHPSSTSDDQSSFEKNFVTIESTGDSQYEDFNGNQACPLLNDDGGCKWNSEQSYSSLEASFDSGVRSPDMFSDEGEEEDTPAREPFWEFLKDFEAYDKRRVRKTELILQGVLPPPSVTVLKTDVSQMLKKYYCFLPAFTNDDKAPTPETNPVTPTKRVSFIHIPTEVETSVQESEAGAKESTSFDQSKSSLSKDSNKSDSELDTSHNEKSVDLKTCTQVEAAQTAWPEVLKCRHYDVYYNVTKYSEKFECLALRYGDRFVGAETDTSVCIHSGGLQSPSSASKRKALRLAQAKSPGRRLSHLARRRQTFCSAATISEKAQGTASKMVLIDKNFFPHRKLINSSDRRSPRKMVLRRTPGKKTPLRKTPGKKTPAKTPKTRSGGSSRKKAMRRLLMDSDHMTRSQPTRETLKRALFVSPEGRKAVPAVPSTSVPVHAMKSKRALFGSPVTAETKSCDGTHSDSFLKRKRDALDDEPVNSRSKIAKSLSFGGDTVGTSQSFSFSRRASEVVMTKSMAELNDHHKQKLLWAVTAALRVHGLSMSSPGFREKASQLARLTRKLLTLPPHAARFAAPNHSTSDTILKVARLYVFAIIQGRTVDDCFEEEKTKLANEGNSKISGYISASAYQQLKNKQTGTSTLTARIKENTCNDGSFKQDQPRSSSKNILQDKLVNIDSSSNSSSGLSLLDRNNLSLFKSHSMPSFEEAAKMRARRQISFDNVDFPKR